MNRLDPKPELLLFNGPPGSGKTTVARMIAESRPLSLRIDIDEVRDLIAGWHSSAGAGGLLARDLAAVMAARHLDAGHDVVVSQVIGHLPDLERFQSMTTSLGAVFREIVLVATREQCLRRLEARHAHGTRERVRVEEFDELHERLVTALESRPHAIKVDSIDGDVRATVRRVQASLVG